jgi:hypothetical protein
MAVTRTSAHRVANRLLNQSGDIRCVLKFDTNTSIPIPKIEKMFSSNIIGRILPQGTKLIGIPSKLCLDWLGC